MDDVVSMLARLLMARSVGGRGVSPTTEPGAGTMMPFRGSDVPIVPMDNSPDSWRTYRLLQPGSNFYSGSTGTFRSKGANNQDPNPYPESGTPQVAAVPPTVSPVSSAAAPAMADPGMSQAPVAPPPAGMSVPPQVPSMPDSVPVGMTPAKPDVLAAIAQLLKSGQSVQGFGAAPWTVNQGSLRDQTG